MVLWWQFWYLALFLVVVVGESEVVADETTRRREKWCMRCEGGSVSDGGGVEADPEKGCLQWCSKNGYCGTSLLYRRGVDCRPQQQQQQQQQRRREQEFDSSFVSAFGEEGFETHKREWDHGEKYGRIISVRGERHCGTGWVRMMSLWNCPEIRHRWSRNLDSDGLYGWKHDFVPETFDSRSRDAIVVVFRSAISWIPKMQRMSYSESISRISRRGSLARFVSTPFEERGRRFEHLLDLRTTKYVQYIDFLESHPNVLGVRYEDLVVEPTFLFRHLARDLDFPCAHDRADFKYVKTYAKYGTTAAKKSTNTPNRTWTRTDWDAVVSRLDDSLENSRLGYAYVLQIPGRWYHLDLPTNSPLLRIENE